MLSNPLHRYSPYPNVSSTPFDTNHRLSQTHLHTINVNPFGHPHHYPLQHLSQHAEIPTPRMLGSAPQSKQRQNSQGSSRKGSTGASGPIRRRISRACDQCNQLRTKCDGMHPCAHCIEFGLGCEYIRERKKRGKASRKDIAAQQAAAAAAAAAEQNGQVHGEKADQDDTPVVRHKESPSAGNDLSHTQPHGHLEGSVSSYSDGGLQQQHPQTMEKMDGPSDTHSQAHVGVDPALGRTQLETSSAMGLDPYGEVSHDYSSPGINGHLMTYGSAHSNMTGYHSLPYAQDPSPGSYNSDGNFRLSNGIHEYPMANGSSPSWGVSLASPPGQFQLHLTQPSFKHTGLRYPVLEPLLPHLGTFLPISLACDLVDFYFSSSSSAQMHPMSPCVLGFVLRKRAFLHPTNPRRCQPALLASMLWVAAQTSEASFLTSLPSARGKICQKLLELTVGLLQPLIHTGSNQSSPKTSPVMGVMDTLAEETGAFGVTGSLDDVITYIHLATVVSASEHKGASLRWWCAAWTLARELKLGRELPSSSPPMNHEHDAANEDFDEHDMSRNGSNFVSEEEREERRRVWWLLYIVDRHLALCYNRPLFLLDSECDRLFHPMDDTLWQSGQFRSHSFSDEDVMIDHTIPNEFMEGTRVRGPNYECRGHSIFGHFLPLMTILGEIVDVHHAKNHPRFGVGFRPAEDWDGEVEEISRHLEKYEESLKRFEQKYLAKSTKDREQHKSPDNRDNGAESDMQSPRSVHPSRSNHMTECEIQTSIIISYSTHVMHVLHILLADKWDPINLLDANDMWVVSEEFVAATSHAVSAAEALGQILEFDPGLEYMPFFYGIYLLQGSFLLLLIAEKLQMEASPSVIKACETIVRAHEACVVTLFTEYQRNFNKVMRNALALTRGRISEEAGEQHQRRRELLGLYRWTGNGTGLAL